MPNGRQIGSRGTLLISKNVRTLPNGVTRFCNGLPSRRILAGRASADVDCRFILTFSEINKVPREPIRRPFGITYLDDHLLPLPINLRQFQRRPKAALPRRRLGERHVVD